MAFWIGINKENGDTELYDGNDFYASWNRIEIDIHAKAVVHQMLDIAYREGKEARSKELKVLLGL